MPPRTERIAPAPLHAAVLLLGLTTLAYLNSFWAVPQFDDYAVIIDEPRVATLSAWWRSMPGVRPLLKLSYALNNGVDGLFGFRLVNLLIHLGNVLLAWRLLRRLLAGEEAAALLGALLFALHPVNTEAVLLLSGRSVALGTLGVLGSLLALLAGRTALSLVLFALAVLVRETALVLPALALLCLAWARWRDGSGHALVDALRGCRWHWLLALVLLGLVLALSRYRELLVFSLALRPPLENLPSGAGAASYLLVQLARPFASNSDPRLTVFEHWDGYWIALCLAWIVAIGWALARVRRGSWLAFALLWFVLALAPTHSLIARLDLANERQLYLAALPLFATVPLLWERALRAIAGRQYIAGRARSHGSPLLWERALRAMEGNKYIAGWARSYGLVVAVVLVLTLMIATVLRNRDYHSETAFWSAVLERDAHNARAWNNLGFALEREQNDAAGALAAYRRAIALDPRDYKAHHNLHALCARLPQEPGCAAL